MLDRGWNICYYLGVLKNDLGNLITREAKQVNGRPDEPDVYFRLTLKGHLFLFRYATKQFISKLFKWKESEE